MTLAEPPIGTASVLPPLASTGPAPSTTIALAPVEGTVGAPLAADSAGAWSTDAVAGGSGPTSVAGPYSPIPRMTKTPTTMTTARTALRPALVAMGSG